MLIFAVMKARRTKIVLASCIAALAVAAACNEEDMLLSYQNTLQVGFYSTRTHADTILTNVSARGLGSDSLLYDEVTANGLYLNLNMHSDSTSFVIRTQTLEDQLHITYHRSLKPVSGAGGITMEMYIDSVSHSGTSGFIDSVAIVNHGVNYNEGFENVQIFVY